MNAQELERLKAANLIEDVARDYGVTFNASGRGRCPFPERHNNGDSHPSFHLDRKHQRARCESQDCFKGAVDVIGLVMKMDGVNFKGAVQKLAQRAGLNNGYPRPPAQSQSRKVLTTHSYQDEQGSLLYQILRYEPKDFVFRRPDGMGGWIWNREGVRLVLYRLPEVLKADGPVVVVGGEKCVDVLRGLEFVSTTNPFGEGDGKWKDEYSALLEGREVILWPDKDEVGRRHMKQVARSLKGAARSVRVVEPPAELPEKGDVADGVQRLGWTREDVTRILDAAQPWEPGGEGLPTENGQKPKEASEAPQERHTVCLSEIEPGEPQWLSKPRLPAAALTLVFGAGGDGKSYVCLAVLAALSKGAGLWDAEGTGTPSTCLYLTGEDSLPLVRRRLDLLGADTQYIRGYAEPFAFDEAGFEFVEREISDHRVEVCVIDPVVAFLGRDLDFYRANEARAILAPLSKVAERTGAAIILVTHVTKGNSTRAAYRAMGSSDFVNAARSALLVGSDPDEPQNKALCHVKCNHGGLADPVGFEIDQVGQFLWKEATGLTAARILGAESGEDEQQAGKLAEELLREMCKVERLASEVCAQAKSEGLSERTLYRAAARLCERRREGFGKGSTVYWKIRDTCQKPHTCQKTTMANMASMASMASEEGVV